MLQMPKMIKFTTVIISAFKSLPDIKLEKTVLVYLSQLFTVFTVPSVSSTEETLAVHEKRRFFSTRKYAAKIIETTTFAKVVRIF